MARLSLLSLACVGLVAALGCEKIIGADFGAKKLEQSCDPVTPPGPSSNAANGAGVDVTLAIYSQEWGDEQVDAGPPGYESIGFDLDGLCTSLNDPLPCHPPSWAAPPMTDGMHGINNGVGALLYSEWADFGQQPVSGMIMNARTLSGQDPPTALFRVSDYNGFYQDEQVTVELLLAVPLGKKPAWDGTDAFEIDPYSATSNGGDGGASVTGRFLDDHAYVTDFTLVAHFGAAAFKLVNVIFPLHDGVLSAKLQSTAPGQWSMSGILAGHGVTQSLLALLPNLTSSYLGLTVCDESTIYSGDNGLKQWLCGSSDSVVNGTPGPNTVCDATSFGVQIETRQVQIAGLATVPDAGPLCAPANDPVHDSCAQQKVVDLP